MFGRKNRKSSEHLQNSLSAMWCRTTFKVGERIKAHGVGRVVSALESAANFTGSMLNQVTFHDACMILS